MILNECPHLIYSDICTVYYYYYNIIVINSGNQKCTPVYRTIISWVRTTEQNISQYILYIPYIYVYVLFKQRQSSLYDGWYLYALYYYDIYGGLLVCFVYWLSLNSYIYHISDVDYLLIVYVFIYVS
jgi:hypothetical protein